RYGFVAEEVSLIDRQLVGYDDSGLPSSVRYSSVVPLLTQALQELDLNLQSIASTTATSTPESQSFAASFFGNVFNRVAVWLGDAANGVGNVFAGTFRAKEKICVDDQCLTKDDVRSLLNLARNGGQTVATGQTSNNSNTAPASSSSANYSSAVSSSSSVSSVGISTTATTTSSSVPTENTATSTPNPSADSSISSTQSISSISSPPDSPASSSAISESSSSSSVDSTASTQSSSGQAEVEPVATIISESATPTEPEPITAMEIVSTAEATD
ncbi:MAG: Peptidase protein, partial [Parcubacteria group bacterium]|nr:Peptidase protein [Parcubacteria group bacterium]